MKVEITEHQLRAIIEAGNSLSSMIGCADDDADREFKTIVKAIDRFLKKNGFKRQHS